MYVLVEDTPGIGSIGYDDALKAVILTWLKNDDATFRPRLEKQLELISSHGSQSVIVDTYSVKGVLNDANQAWLADDFFPRMAKTSLKALISVVPQSAIASLTNTRSFGGARVPFALISVHTVDEAHAIAARVAKGLPAKV